MSVLLGLWIVSQLADKMQLSEIGSVRCFFFLTGIWYPVVFTAHGHWWVQHISSFKLPSAACWDCLKWFSTSNMAFFRCARCLIIKKIIKKFTLEDRAIKKGERFMDWNGCLDRRNSKEYINLYRGNRATIVFFPCVLLILGKSVKTCLDWCVRRPPAF